jgi:hypothetical protein
MQLTHTVRLVRFLVLLFSSTAWLACGGSSTQPAPATSPFAGNYQIVQRTIDTSCGDTGTPATVTGTVTHAAGTEAFTLRDTGGTTFNGTVQSSGAFTGNAVFGPDSSGQTYTQRLEGTFSTSGFTARLNVTVSPRNCAFSRDWTGTKVP